MRARTNLPVKEKRRVELSELRGMDFASSPLLCSPQRACVGKNWEPVDGINRKRRGWEQMLPALPARINGIFPYTRDTGEEELIVYAGTSFYRVSTSALTYEEIPMKNTVGVLYWTRLDRRCQAFLSGGYLYFVGCGILFRYGKFDGVYEVRTVDPYVPTTTVGIGCEESADSARESRDPANLLTRERKNTLFGSESAAKWFLDGAIASGSSVTVNGTVRSGDGVAEVVYTNSDASDKTKLYNAQGVLSGSLSYSEGSISLLDPTASPSDAPNLTVWFTAAENSFGAAGVGGISMIYGCAFGSLFGVGGTEDRLFLSGNPEYPNMVFFSERQDFSYFPDQFTATLGTDGRAVTGLLPLSDSTMAIFKERGEADGSVYYMKGEYRSFYTEKGDLKKTIPVFSIVTSGRGESPVNPFSLTNLSGEALLLSRDGVYGIEYFENVVSDVRVTRKRGSRIAPRLSGEALEEAVAAVHGERLYLAMGTHCYVTERKYRYRDEGATDAEYEWWYWENFPARIFCEVGDELWFGTESGTLCRLSDTCVDTSFHETKEGEITFAYGTGAIVPSQQIASKMPYGRALRFLTKGILAWVSDGCLKIEGKSIYVSDGVLDLIYDGLPVYVATLGTSTLQEGRVYYICNTDRAKSCFSLSSNKNGTARSLDGLTDDVRIFTEISEETVYVGTMDLLGTARHVRLTPGGPNLRLADYFRPKEVGSEIRLIPTNPICRILTESPVSAYWESPILELGTNLYSKDLSALTLSALRHAGETLTFGYETERGRHSFSAALPDALILDHTDLASVSLERGLQETVLKRVREKNFHSIRFFFSSDTKAPTTVFGVGGIYKINKMKKGVVS